MRILADLLHYMVYFNAIILIGFVQTLRSLPYKLTIINNNEQ